MASVIFNTNEFKGIVNGNLFPDQKTEKSEETRKKIVFVSQSIIKHLRSSDLRPDEIKLLNKFITKLKYIKDRAEPSNKTQLKKYIFALKTLSALKESNPNISREPFIYELFKNKYNTSFEEPLDFYVLLIGFQDTVLLPAIKNAKTLEEYEALSSLVDECSSSAEKLRTVLGPQAIEYLNGKEDELLILWNAKALQLEPFYQALLQYKKNSIGSLSNVEDRDKLIKNISYVLKALDDEMANPHFTREEKAAIYRAIKTLESEFSEAGHPILFPTKSLKRDLGILTSSTPREISKEDLTIIQKLSKQIIDLKPTIGDANAYPFSAAYGSYINDAKTKQGSLDLLAAGLRAHSKRMRYSESPEEIVRLGRDLLRNKSGQCDHMAAAVIAKIVEHIRNGGRWNFDVELAGNKGHSFVIINRAEGETSTRATWDNAVVVDTWLGSIGVHPDYQDYVPSPKEGVISDSKDIVRFARFFGVRKGRVCILQRLSAQELRELAAQKI